MNNYLFDAIRLLKPTAEFSFSDNDYSTIKWDVLEGEAPTQSQIDAAIEQVKINEIAKTEARAQAKAIAESKLGALGLTTNDLRALGL
jgi:hypothetical protein